MKANAKTKIFRVGMPLLMLGGGAHSHSVKAAAVTHATKAPTVDGTAQAAPNTILKDGDIYAARLDTQQALACYLAAEKAQPEGQNPDPTLLVKIARQYRHLMADVEAASEKVRIGNQAMAYSKRAAALAPEDSDAVLSVAITYGKLIKYLPKKEQVAASKIIKASAERAVKLDSKNDLAWNVLGRWHRVSAEMGGTQRAIAGMLYEKLPPASNEEAARCLETAVRINPQRLMHNIELGKAYANMGRKDDARRYLSKGLGMPVKEKDDPAMKQAGREALAALN